MLKYINLVLFILCCVGCATTASKVTGKIDLKETATGGEACYPIMGHIECKPIATTYWFHIEGRKVAVYKETFDAYNEGDMYP